jgi:hypothetical protein
MTDQLRSDSARRRREAQALAESTPDEQAAPAAIAHYQAAAARRASLPERAYLTAKAASLQHSRPANEN